MNLRHSASWPADTTSTRHEGGVPCCLDPDDFLSRDELLEKIWTKRLPPALRAQCLAECIAQGITYMDFMRLVAARYDAAMEDPIEYEKWLRISREMYRREPRRRTSPRLGKDGQS